MKLTISDIEWDYPGEEHKKCPLPTEVVVEDPDVLSYLLEDVDDYSDNIADYLSDTYGYCVYGFTTDVEGGDKE